MSDKEAREHVARILRKVIVGQGFKPGKRNGFVKEAEHVYQMVRIRKSAFGPMCFVDLGVVFKRIVEKAPDGWMLGHFEGDPNTALGEYAWEFVRALHGDEVMTDEERAAIFTRGFVDHFRPAFDALLTVETAEEWMTSGRDERTFPYHWRPMRVIREWVAARHAGAEPSP